MNLLTGEESRELFGGDVMPAVRHLIDVARNAPYEQVVAALWTAALSSPRSLAVYYLLYKLHARHGELAQARQAAEKGIAAAAAEAGLDTQWSAVRPGDADFTAPGPARFWLFTLKALAFITLRQGERDTSAGIVARLRELDPHDHVGFGVIQTLLEQTA
jgi:hypothetical protein